MQPPGSQPLSMNFSLASCQWQPETYDHRFGSGLATDAGKVPPMTISTLSPPEEPTTHVYIQRTLLGVG